MAEITAADLGRLHLGKTITVQHEHQPPAEVVRGLLRAVSHHPENHGAPAADPALRTTVTVYLLGNTIDLDLKGSEQVTVSS